MPRFEDFTGMKINELTVDSYAGNSYWNCTCSCGNKTVVRSYELKRGMIKKCKICSKYTNLIDITGNTYGYWEVLEYAGDKKWKCKCTLCGKIGYVFKQNLIKGNSKSCSDCASILKTHDIVGNIYGNLKVVKMLGRNSHGTQDVECECLKCGSKTIMLKSNVVSGNSTQCENCRKLALIKDICNKQIGEWHVDSYDKNGYWNCTCSCGKKARVHGWALRVERTKSCGHDLIINLTGEQIGEWEVLRYKGNSYWECKCSCGKIKNVHSYELRNGFSESCGCQKFKKIKQTMLERYNEYIYSKINNPRTSWEREAIESKEKMLNVIQTFNSKPSVFELSQILKINESNVLKHIHKFEIEEYVDINPSVSKYEKQISEWIKSIGANNIVQSNKTILNGKELDIYIPDKKLAIEFNGDYWHSTIYKNRNYHQEKSLACEKQGIRLIHIFEYEWQDETKQEKIKTLLKSILTPDNIKLYGRDTEVQDITVAQAREFCEKYHLQGYVRSIINLGLIYNNELIAVMTFGFPRFNREYNFEILRLCYKNNISVIGGTQKLLEYFKRNYNPTSIISYCNIAKFSGQVYENIGFKLKSISSPNYVWVDTSTNNVLTRYQTQKHKLIRDGLGTEDQTEDEIMESIGYLKVYDAGNKVYTFE